MNPLGGQQEKLKHLIDYEECKEDIYKYCSHSGVEIKSDFSILECLQDVKLSETELLTGPCEHLVWNFKVSLSSDGHYSCY